MSYYLPILLLTFVHVLKLGKVVTFAGGGAPGRYVSGYADGPGSQALFQFNGGGGITVDRYGQIFVTDGGNKAIRMITPQGVTFCMKFGFVFISFGRLVGWSVYWHQY